MIRVKLCLFGRNTPELKLCSSECGIIRRHIALVWQKLSNSGVSIRALSLVPYGMWIDVSKLCLHALHLHRRNLSEGLWGGKPRLPCWMMMNNGSVAPGALANSHQLPEARPPNQPLTVDSWMSPAEPSSKTQTAGPKKTVNSINSCLTPPHCGVLCYVAKADTHGYQGKKRLRSPTYSLKEESHALFLLALFYLSQGSELLPAFGIQRIILIYLGDFEKQTMGIVLPKPCRARPHHSLAPLGRY